MSEIVASVRSWATLALVLLTAACVHPSWQGLASRAALVRQVRLSSTSTSTCDAQATVLGDYGFSVQCGASPTYVRCGYHHGGACCWPVEDEAAATDVFGQSSHTRQDLVCGPL